MTGTVFAETFTKYLTSFPFAFIITPSSPKTPMKKTSKMNLQLSVFRQTIAGKSKFSFLSNWDVGQTSREASTWFDHWEFPSRSVLQQTMKVGPKRTCRKSGMQWHSCGKQNWNSNFAKWRVTGRYMINSLLPSHVFAELATSWASRYCGLQYVSNDSYKIWIFLSLGFGKVCRFRDNSWVDLTFGFSKCVRKTWSKLNIYIHILYVFIYIEICRFSY